MFGAFLLVIFCGRKLPGKYLGLSHNLIWEDSEASRVYFYLFLFINSPFLSFFSPLMFSCYITSDSLQPLGLQHARPPCPPLSPAVCSDSCPLSQRCSLTILFSGAHFSFCHHSFPVSRSFPLCVISQSCPTFCNPMDHNPPGSSVHAISQARILEQVAIPSPRRSSQPRDRSHISCPLHWHVDSLLLAPIGKPKRKLFNGW